MSNANFIESFYLNFIFILYLLRLTNGEKLLAKSPEVTIDVDSEIYNDQDHVLINNTSSSTQKYSNNSKKLKLNELRVPLLNTNIVSHIWNHDKNFDSSVWNNNIKKETNTNENDNEIFPVYDTSNKLQRGTTIVGFVGDIFTDPLILIGGIPLWGNLVKTAGTAVDDRQTTLGVLEELENSSLDFYSSIRSMYIQKRADEIETDKAQDYRSYLNK